MFRLPLFLLLIAFSSTMIHAQDVSCFDEYVESEELFRLEEITIRNGDVSLSAELYLPKSEGLYPALLLLPGGGNNVNNLRNVPIYLAKRAAACGIIALFYDKRGTGNSSGEYSETDFNDLISDAEAAVDFLASHKEVNNKQIGASGFSQGGRLIANLAVRNNSVSFIAGVSGPINRVGPNRYYAFKNSLDRTQLSDSVKSLILPYWEEHFNALEARDHERSLALDDEIREASTNIYRSLLPPYHADRDQNPIYNSMGLDLLSELKNLSIPWYSIYGEEDRIVPAKQSIENIKEAMELAKNENFTIELIPGVNHSLLNPGTQEQIPFEKKIFEWVLMVIQES
ncbi:MAG: alpha/beta fold hydrolase [Balneola sp.]|nr:MAG: alpha/beta fold hydrolase [Balneola sp.]